MLPLKPWKLTRTSSNIWNSNRRSTLYFNFKCIIVTMSYSCIRSCRFMCNDQSSCLQRCRIRHQQGDREKRRNYYRYWIQQLQPNILSRRHDQQHYSIFPARCHRREFLRRIISNRSVASETEHQFPRDVRYSTVQEVRYTWPLYRRQKRKAL